MQAERVEWAAEPVEYMLQREFHGYVPLGVWVEGHPKLQRPSRLREVDTRRKELEALPLEKQSRLAAMARAKELKETQTKAEGHEAMLLFGLLALDAKFGFWARSPYWSLEEGVLLWWGMDPEIARWVNISSMVGAPGAPKSFVHRYELARRAVSMRQLGEMNPPNVFIAWAKHRKLPFPKELEVQVAQFGAIEDWRGAYEQAHADLEAAGERIAVLERELADAKDIAAHRWPWGTYETDLLRKLHAAVERYWVKYDAGDPSTASNSDDVVDWLRSQKVGGKPIAQRVSEVIAQVIRADGLRTGPR